MSRGFFTNLIQTLDMGIDSKSESNRKIEKTFKSESNRIAIKIGSGSRGLRVG